MAAQKGTIYGTGTDHHHPYLVQIKVSVCPAALCKQRPPHGARPVCPSHNALAQPVSPWNPREKEHLSLTNLQKEQFQEFSVTFYASCPRGHYSEGKRKQINSFHISSVKQQSLCTPHICQLPGKMSNLSMVISSAAA